MKQLFKISIHRMQLCWMLIVSVFLSLSLSAQDVSNLIPQIKDAVFTVYAMDADNIYASGSGFFISSTGIGVTNFHVLQGASNGYIKCINGTEYPIKHIIDYNPEYDLIKFQVSTPNGYAFKSLLIQPQLPLQGEFIVNYSNPLGEFENTASTGIVSAIRDYTGYEKVLQITAPISHGSSGSPVMNQRGEVLGVATFGFEQGQSLNFAVCSSQLQKMKRNLCIPVANMQKDPKETPLVKRGQVLAKNGQYSEAFEAFSKAIQADSTNYLAYFYRGLWRCRTENDMAGVPDLLQSCLLDTMCYDCYLKTANFVKNTIIRIHDQLADVPNELIELAMHAYQRCFELDPNQPEAYGDCGYLLVHIAQNKKVTSAFEMGLQLLNICIDMLPTNVYYIMCRAELYEDIQDYGKALIDCDRAIELDRDNYRPYFTKGIIQAVKLRQYNEGIQTLLRAESLAPTEEYKAQVWGFLGDTYMSKYLSGRDIQDVRTA